MGLTTLAQNGAATNTRTLVSYTSLDAAVNDAEAGDTLNLSATSFNERLTLTQSIVIKGAASGGTILDIRNTPGYGISIQGSSIVLENITILSSPTHFNYAIHSEPGTTGITLKNIVVFNNATTGIDLNGLAPDEPNVIENCVSSGSASGFGLALSSCQNVRVTDFTSASNGFGDIGILESLHTEQLSTGLLFSGEMNLLGQNGDGLGALIVQSDLNYVNPGTTADFDINMQSNLLHQIAAITDDFDGALFGYILCKEDNVADISDNISTLPGVTGLYARNLLTGAMEVWPGMSLSEVLAVTPPEGLIQILHPGNYDSTLVVIDKAISIIGPNAGISGFAPDRDVEALFTGGLAITASNVYVDGIRILNTNTNSDGLTVSANAADIEIRNTVIRGSYSETGVTGQVGVRNAGQTALYDCSLRNWDLAALLSQGDMRFFGLLAADNRNALEMNCNDGEHSTLQVMNGNFTNAGGDAFSVSNSDLTDSLIVSGVFGDLHRHAFQFSNNLSYNIANNVFVHSEEQIIGLTSAERILLCEENAFSLPSIEIEACTEEGADNYEPCATINFGCEFNGCTDALACNYNENATTDDGSCDFTSCYGCLNPLACNYNPLATAEGDVCDFLSCRGCTNPNATNYNPTSTLDDGSCRIQGCTNPLAINFDPLANVNDGTCEVTGCTDFEACNYTPDADTNDGTCEYLTCSGCTDIRACNHDPSASIDSGDCEFLSCRGCMNPDALNYNATATIDDGSCRILGCTDPTADNYNPEAMLDDGLCTFSGCTDSNACNYEPGISSDDESCDYTTCAGCAIPGMCNYDPTATIHNGTMCEYLSCCGDPNASNYDADIFPQLIFGCIYGSSANMVFLDDCNVPFACNYLDAGPCDFDSCSGCTDAGACNYDEAATISTNTCTYAIDIFGLNHVDCSGACLNDINSNGICDESELLGCTDQGACNYNALASGDDGSCESLSCGGCTDNVACNYDASVTLNNGSCEYVTCTGCMDSTACNYNPAASVDSGCEYPLDIFGSGALDCNGNCINDTDQNGACDEEEVPGCTAEFACNYSPDATQSDGSCDYNSCAGCTDNVSCNYDPSAIINDNTCDYTTCAGCLDSEACNYNLNATVSAPCIYPLEAYLDCDGECLNDADGDGVCAAFEVPGCTDPQSCNYNDGATDDDGSCNYTSCAGCTNPGACNYQSGATINDGSCAYYVCQGCMEPDACNYAPDATIEDGSCTYPLDIYNDPTLTCNGTCIFDDDGDGICDPNEIQGCTDPEACNYDPLAEVESGFCEFTTCLGCTDIEACNYNEYATTDDGTCADAETLFGSSAYDCSGTCFNDTDEDGVCDELEIEGCTDETACNFDPNATEEDGTCVSIFDLYGSVNVDCEGVCLNDADSDGVCDEDEVEGCTNDEACNYDPLATDDNDSCTFPVDLYGVPYLDCAGACLDDVDGDGICDQDEACLGDFNNDGLRSAADILTMLSAYGCLSGCGEEDLNGDGIVTSADILILLTVFGTFCD